MRRGLLPGQCCQRFIPRGLCEQFRSWASLHWSTRRRCSCCSRPSWRSGCSSRRRDRLPYVCGRGRRRSLRWRGCRCRRSLERSGTRGGGTNRGSWFRSLGQCTASKLTCASKLLNAGLSCTQHPPNKTATFACTERRGGRFLSCFECTDEGTTESELLHLLFGERADLSPRKTDNPRGELGHLGSSSHAAHSLSTLGSDRERSKLLEVETTHHLQLISPRGHNDLLEESSDRADETGDQCHATHVDRDHSLILHADGLLDNRALGVGGEGVVRDHAGLEVDGAHGVQV